MNRALLTAAIGGNLDEVKRVSHEDKSHDLPLIGAARRGHLDVVEHLIRCGADVHTGGELPLKIAASGGYLDIVKFLIRQGVVVNSHEGSLALIMAAREGYLSLVTYLVSRGADVNAQDGEALFQAASHGNLAMVKLLLSQGARVNSRAVLEALSEENLNVAIHLLRKDNQIQEVLLGLIGTYRLRVVYWSP